MRRVQRYYDGLDADGYPINEPYRKPYIHGSEADAGEFKVVSFGEALYGALERASASSQIGNSAESPIELQLGAALVLFFRNAGKPLKLCLEVERGNKLDDLLLVPQFKWSFYRSDWAIVNPSRDGALLLECDGRDFHSTDDQKAHDAKKDASARDYGFLTMRFTGSQIYRDADGCAQKVYDAVYGGE